MSADKRTVSTDALETLGTIINAGEKRDAIHLAVIPVIAGARLCPSQSIDCNDGIATPAKDGLGIVDPFLGAVVQPEQHFWMVLRPRLIKSLRHVWSHPSFPDEPGVIGGGTTGATSDKAAAMAVIQQCAAGCDIEASELIEGAHAFLDHGDYLCDGGRWEGVRLPDAFWPAFATFTGRNVDPDKQYSFFSCSC